MISAGSMSCMLTSDDAVLAVVLVEHDGDGFPATGGQVLADIVGADGQLAVPPVHEDGQADHAGAAEVHEGVHGGPDRPAREEDVVHQDNRQALEGEGDFGAADDGLARARPEVVPVERDVERAHRGALALDGGDLLRDALGQRLAPRLDADQGEVGVPRLLDDLMCDAGQRAVEARLVEHFRLLPGRGHGAAFPSPRWGEGRVRGPAGQKKRPALGWAALNLVSRCFIPSPCGPLRVRLKE